MGPRLGRQCITQPDQGNAPEHSGQLAGLPIWPLNLLCCRTVQVLTPGQATLPAEVTSERFLTPFLTQFVVGTAQAA